MTTRTINTTFPVSAQMLQSLDASEIEQQLKDSASRIAWRTATHIKYLQPVSVEMIKAVIGETVDDFTANRKTILFQHRVTLKAKKRRRRPVSWTRC